MGMTAGVPGYPRAGYLLAGITIILSLAQLGFAQCTTNAAGITSCSYSNDFTTGGQSLFATGNGTVSFSGTVGTSWNAKGSVGSIVNETVGGQNAGDYGAIISGSTSGNISLTGSAIASGGNLSANVPVSLTLQLPSSVHPGDTFAVTSNYAYGSGVNFSTQSPTIGFGVAVGFNLQASLGVEACAASCVGFSNTPIVNTGQQTLNILQYNEAGSVQNPTLPTQGAPNANQLIALNQNLTDQLNSNLKGSKDLIPGVLALTYDASTTNLGFSSTSTVAGNGLYTASGQTANTVLGLDLNVANAVTSALDLPALSGSVGDLVCDSLGVPCSDTEKNVLNNASYNILSADLTLGVSPSQQYSMTLNGATLGLQMYDQNGAKVGAVSFNAGGTATLTYPTLAANGTAITRITIAPTLTLADPTFTTQTGLTLVPGVDISALGMGAGPLSLGPLFDYSPSLPPIPQLTLNSTTFGLGGFSSQTLGSTSAVGANTTIANTSTISNNIDFQNLTATGQSLSYDTLRIHDSNVTGGTFNANANSTATIIGDGAGLPQTLLNGVTLNLPGGNPSSPYLTTSGNVTFVNSNVQDAGIPSNYTVQVQSGTLTLQNSAMTNQLVQINTALVLSQSSMTGGFTNYGTLTLDHSTLTVPDNFPETAGNDRATLNLNNGSTMHIGANVTLANNGGTINIGTGSLLQSDYYLLGGVINIAAGGTLTAAGTVDSSAANSITSNAGGVVNLNGVTGLFMKIQNTSGGVGGVVNVSGNTTLNGGSISGMALININSSAQLDLKNVQQFSAASVVNNGILSGDSTVTASVLNNGTIANYLLFSGNVTNSASGLILGGQFIGLSNQGGTVELQNGGVLNMTTAGLTGGPDNSQFTQSSGNTIVDGTLISTNTIKLEGGTLSGTGAIQGSVQNDGGILSPGDGGVGTLTFDEVSYTQGAGGTLSINIDSLTDFSKLDFSGTGFMSVNLGGTLDVVLGASFLSQLESNPGGLDSFLGTQFDILDLGSDQFRNESLKGAFGNFDFTDSNGNALPFGFTWDVSEVFPSFITDAGAPYAELLLTFSTVADCGSLGQSLLNGDVSGGCLGDFSPDDIAPSTFDPGPLDLTSSTPEPGTMLLFAAGLALVVLMRRKGRRNGRPFDIGR